MQIAAGVFRIGNFEVIFKVLHVKLNQMEAISRVQ